MSTSKVSTSKSTGKKVRRPKGSVSVSVETLQEILMHALLMSEGERLVDSNPDPFVGFEHLVDRFNKEPIVAQKIGERFEYLISQSVLYASLAPFFERIPKQRSPAAVLHAAYALVRLGWITSGRLQPGRVTKTDNEEILGQAILMAGQDPNFKKILEKLLAKGEDHLLAYARAQLPECRYEFQRQHGLYRRQQVIAKRLRDRLDGEGRK